MCLSELKQPKVVCRWQNEILKYFCGRVPWLYQYWPVGLCLLWFYVQELPKAQPAVVLVLKRLRRRGNGLKSHPTDWEKLLKCDILIFFKPTSPYIVMNNNKYKGSLVLKKVMMRRLRFVWIFIVCHCF